MFHQRDYLLRLIEQMGAALVELRNLILGRAADPQRVDDELAALAGRAGMDLPLLRGFSLETLLMFVSPTGDIEPGRCWLMAELLYLDGLEAVLDGRPDEGREGLRKALGLFRMIEPGGGLLVGLPEAAERIEEIEARLAELGV